MSLYLSSRVLVWTPKSICVRTMKSINTRVAKPVHIQRAKVMHFTRPKLPRDNRRMEEKCTIKMKEEMAVMLRNRPMVPIEEWMTRQVQRAFFPSQMVAVFHKEDMPKDMDTKLWRRLKKSNMQLKVYNNRVVSAALEGSKLQNMEPLIVSKNVYIISEEPQVKELLKITSKVPRIHLLGGFVIDRLMSADEMRDYAKLPSIEGLHGQLAGILSSATSRTYQLLQANQQRLGNNLGQLAKQMSDDAKEGDS